MAECRFEVKSMPPADQRSRPDARCPLRPQDPCTLCQLDVTGPHDCPLVYLARSDDDVWSFRTRPTVRDE